MEGQILFERSFWKFSCLYELSRQKILKRSPRKLEKLPFVAGITTKTSRVAEFDPADHILPVRSEIFFGQKFSARKLVRPYFFGSKVENCKNFWIEI
jgi:hypothetical protein